MSQCKKFGFLVLAAVATSLTEVLCSEHPTSKNSVEFFPKTNPLIFEAGGQPVFLDTLLRKFMMPLGLISPYFSLFDDDEVDFPDVLSGLFTRRLRGGGRSLGTEPARSPKQNIKHFTGTLHEVLGGNIFNPAFAERLIDELPEPFSQQLSALIDAVGGNLLDAVADAESPASVVFQQIMAPLEGDGLPFLIPENFDSFSAPAQRVLQDDPNWASDVAPPTDILPLSPTEWTSPDSVFPNPAVLNNLEARSVLMSIARDLGEPYGVGDLYANLAATFTDEFLLPGGVAQETAALLLEASERAHDSDKKLLESWDPLVLFRRSVPSMNKTSPELTALLTLAAKVGRTMGSESFFMNVARTFYWFLVPLKLEKTVCDLLLSRQESLLKVAALKAAILSKSTGTPAVVSLLGPKALTALAVKKGIELLKIPLLLSGTDSGVPLKELWTSEKWSNPLASVKILKSAVQIGDSLGKGLLYMAVAKAVIQALFEPLGITEKIANLLVLRVEEVKSSTKDPAFPDISFADVLDSLKPDMSLVGISSRADDRHNSSYDSIVKVALQIGERAGNSALLGALTTFFLDAVVDPLGLTEALADMIPSQTIPRPSASTEDYDIDVNEMVENLMTAMALA